MKDKLLKLVIIIAPILSITGIVLAKYSYSLKLCEVGNISCDYYLSEKIAQPLFFLSLAIFIASLLVLFTNEKIKKFFVNFSLIYIIVAIFLIAITEPQCGAALGLCFDSELATWWLSGIYLAITISIILFSHLKKQKQ